MSARSCASAARSRTWRRWPAISSTMPANGRASRVRVSAGARMAAGAPSSAHRFEDDGPGLPAEDREAALVARAAASTRSKPGSGLGLSIVVELARIYGGSLKLEVVRARRARRAADAAGSGRLKAGAFPPLPECERDSASMRWAQTGVRVCASAGGCWMRKAMLAGRGGSAAPRRLHPEDLRSTTGAIPGANPRRRGRQPVRIGLGRARAAASARRGRPDRRRDRPVARRARPRRWRSKAEYEALEYGRAGQPTVWQSRAGSNHGEIIVGPTYEVNRLDCREYSHNVYIGGRRSASHRGTACRAAATALAGIVHLTHLVWLPTAIRPGVRDRIACHCRA